MNDRTDLIELRLMVKPHTIETLRALSQGFDVPGSIIAAEFLAAHLTISSAHRLVELLHRERQERAGQLLAAKRARDRARKAAARRKPPGSEGPTSQ